MKWMLDSEYNGLPVIHLKNHHGTLVFRKMNDGTILKTVNWEFEKTIKKLKKLKQQEHVIYPKEIYRVMCSNLLTYTQEYAKDMEHMDSFSKFQVNYSDKEILEFFKSLLITLSKIHDSGVISGDITYSNIIMDENLDYNFIDFDLAYVGKLRGLIASCAITEIPYLSNFDEVMLRGVYAEEDMFRYFDKANLVNMMLYAIIYGTIPSKRLLTPLSNFEKLEAEDAIQEEFRRFLAWDEKTSSSNYMIDVLDHLIEHDYKLPYRKRK